MEIDLFCELASPRTLGGTLERAFDDIFPIAGAADRLGYGALWLPEHHFLGDYSAAANADPYGAGWLVVVRMDDWENVKSGFVPGAEVASPYEVKMAADGFDGCA